MIQISKQDIEDALKLIDNGVPKPVGYRIMVKPIQTREGLEGAEIEKYETLAAVGLVTKTNQQKEREDKGTFYGIVMDVGPFAYKAAELGGSRWVEPGNIVITERYAGIEVEWPPGSGEKVRFINDESILGRMTQETK